MKHHKHTPKKLFKVLPFLLSITITSCVVFNPLMIDYSPTKTGLFSAGINTHFDTDLSGFGLTEEAYPAFYNSIKPTINSEIYSEISFNFFVINARYTFSKKNIQKFGTLLLSTGIGVSSIEDSCCTSKITWIEIPLAVTFRAKPLIWWIAIKPGISMVKDYCPIDNNKCINFIASPEITSGGGFGFVPAEGFRILFVMSFPYILAIPSQYPFTAFSLLLGYDFFLH